jgi:hypothetical protein
MTDRPKRTNAKIVVAEAYGCDVTDVERYQQTWATRRMWTVESAVVAACPEGEAPPKGYVWRDVTSDWTRARHPGWRVWERDNDAGGSTT